MRWALLLFLRAYATLLDMTQTHEIALNAYLQLNLQSYLSQEEPILNTRVSLLPPSTPYNLLLLDAVSLQCYQKAIILGVMECAISSMPCSKCNFKRVVVCLACTRQVLLEGGPQVIVVDNSQLFGANVSVSLMISVGVELLEEGDPFIALYAVSGVLGTIFLGGLVAGVVLQGKLTKKKKE